MATSPRKQQTKAAVQQANPLGDDNLNVDLGSNLGQDDDVPAEFIAAASAPAAHIDPEVEFFDPSQISPMDLVAFRQWQTA